MTGQSLGAPHLATVPVGGFDESIVSVNLLTGAGASCSSAAV